jgi:hypothetical protein
VVALAAVVVRFGNASSRAHFDTVRQFKPVSRVTCRSFAFALEHFDPVEFTPQRGTASRPDEAPMLRHLGLPIAMDHACRWRDGFRVHLARHERLVLMRGQ